jgi:diazepam-binding inhibitor (GABA receptor modulating acyl-CoA-binding protein)
LQEDFDKAAEDAKTKVPENASNEDKLALYGLFKQATVGDVNTGENQNLYLMPPDRTSNPCTTRNS